MTNHPTRSTYRYFKVCPRGFANEVTYYKVPLEKITECDAEYAHYTDDHYAQHGYAEWTSDKVARAPGVAIDWADRNC